MQHFLQRIIVLCWLTLIVGLCGYNGIFFHGEAAAAEKQAQLSNEESAITISEPSPADEGAVGSLNPTLSVTVRHSKGKAMDITFRSDGSGEFLDIVTYSNVPSGIYKARPSDMVRRGTTYAWQVIATDGKVKQEKSFNFNLAQFIGLNRQVIMTSDCWTYGYIKHGWEKGKFFATCQRGMWAAYDLDKGWYRTFQLTLKRKNTSGMTGGLPKALEDGGAVGHPFWGYWDGKYRVIGLSRYGASGWEAGSSRTFEGFRNVSYEDDVKDLGIRTQQSNWPEGTTYTFSEDRAWLMAVDYDEPNKKSNVKYWEWTKEGGWKQPVIVGSIATPASGRVALVRHTRDIWYLFLGEGPANNGSPTFSSTLKYFKTTDAGKTWGPLQDTGVPAHSVDSSVSFARYGDNYWVFVSADNDTYIYFTRDLEKWPKETRRRVAEGLWSKPNGTLLHQSALIFTAAGNFDYINEQYGCIVVIPEMISFPEKPTEPSPADGATLNAGTTGAELAVKVHGKQTYDVAFYWEDGTFIGEDKLLREGDIACVKVSGLEPGKTYKWYAIARGALLEYYGSEPDTTSDEKRSEIFNFAVNK